MYPIDGAACMPAMNGKENMNGSWTSVCQTWGYLKAQFGCAGKHQLYARKFHAPAKLLL